MTYTYFTNGSIITAPQANQDFARGMSIQGNNTIRQLIDRTGIWSAGQIEGWGDAYTDTTGRDNSVDTGATTALFDTNKYKCPNILAYVIIEADDATITWTDNNCLIKKITTGKWCVYSTTGTAEVQRAQIHKSLWYGTTGGDLLINDFTNVTAVKVSTANDVGKQAHYALLNKINGSATTYTGTFDNTTTNTNCSSWSIVVAAAGASGGSGIRWELPAGTTLNQLTGAGTTDELGTDTTADEDDNPANCQLDDTLTAYNPGTYVRTIILCVGDITWVGSGPSTVANIDFLTDNSIPVFTTSGTLDAEGFHIEIVHGIPAGTFSATTKEAILVPMIEDWEPGADIKFSVVNATGSTGWLACGSDSQIESFPVAFLAEPGSVIVQLIPTTGATAFYPSIRGIWMYGD